MRQAHLLVALALDLGRAGAFSAFASLGPLVMRQAPLLVGLALDLGGFGP